MHTEERFVVFIDILGFQSIIDRVKDAEVLGDQISNIFQNSILSSLLGESVDVKSNPELDVIETIKIYQFSDSIIMYSNNTSDEVLEDLIKSLNLLLAQSAIRGFPLRGALSRGKLYVNGSTIVGDPLVRAYKLEGRQEWSGLIIDRETIKMSIDLLNELIAQKLISVENICMKDINDKDKFVVEEHLVINWPEFCGRKVTSEDNFYKSLIYFTGIPEKKREKEKLKNTVEFFKKNLGFGELPNFRFGLGEVIFNESGKPLFMPSRVD